MAGIYFHIPFCSKACHYCDFHFSTNLDLKKDIVDAMAREVHERAKYLSAPVTTIYFGGGTPSLLSKDELNKLIIVANETFDVSKDAEVTLEANPDDLSREKLRELKAVGVNRLSIGIQSFNEDDLQFMNRSHTSSQATECVKMAQDEGFDNISIDLIFALPGKDIEWLKANIEKAIALNVQHISCYGLTVEDRTVLADNVKKGLVIPADDRSFREQYQLLIDMLRSAGFIQYEISNFAKPGYISRHNSSYWKGEPYLGIGPSAHSFNGDTRRWNVRNNHLYLRNILSGNNYFEEEILTTADKVNEYLLTSLRTIWGVDLKKLKDLAEDHYDEIMHEASKHIANNELKVEENKLFLTEQGKFICDSITSDLFITDVRTDNT